MKHAAQPRSAAPAPPSAPAVGRGAEFPDCARDCQLRSEADHRIANHLALLASYTRMKSANFAGAGFASHASVRLYTQSIEAQIRAVARLHRLMTLQAGGGASAADLSPLLHEICAPFTGGPAERVVVVEDLEEGCSVDIGHVLPIGQIIGEAIANALKYAIPDSAAGVLLIRSRRTEQNTICIEVIDNGPGLPAAFDPESDGGFGFRLMRSISRGMRAPLIFDSGPQGLRVSLILPQPEPAVA